jgi:hypothetical protein
MDYTELGYSKLLTKSTYSPNSNELTESEASQAISSISGSNISGGSSTSPDKKLEIDWDNEEIRISDGAQKRAQLGNLDKTDKFGVRIRDKKGNIRFEVSDDVQKFSMFDSSYIKTTQIDENGFHAYDSLGNEVIKVDDEGLHAYNTSASELVTVDSTGIKVVGGNISIKDTGANTVLDSSGIVSTTQFSAASVQGSGTQVTDDTSYVDVSGVTVTFTLARTQLVLLFGQFFGITHSGIGYPKTTLLVDSTTVGSVSYGAWLNLFTQEILSLSAGSHTLKLRFKVSGGDPSDEVEAIRSSCLVGYVALGK